MLAIEAKRQVARRTQLHQPRLVATLYETRTDRTLPPNNDKEVTELAAA
jgi:hypothetical protein